ncbi:MAG: hypothetical protein ACFFEY_12680 [Candidatus Thorarchaeota archaeon]
MTQNIDLKDFINNILKTSHQHGFFDLMIGLIVFGMSFAPIFNESLPMPYNSFLWPLILVSLVSITIIISFKYVIQPRIGKLKPGSELKSIGKKILILVSIQLAVHITFLLMLSFGSGLGVHVEGISFILIISLFFIPLFFTLAYLMKFPRLYLIGMLIWIAIIINELLHASLDIGIRWILSYGIIGGIILLMGLIIFIKFLKKNPLSKSRR